MKTLAPALLIVAALAGLTLTGCGKKEQPAPPPVTQAPAPAPAPVEDLVNVPVAVKAVTLGNQIGADMKVAASLASFAAKDTIYAVVDTIGSGKATLKAVWTYHKGDKTAPVNETTQELEAAGPASSEFHISKPDGWPVGEYSVEVSLNGAAAGTQTFSVK